MDHSQHSHDTSESGTSAGAAYTCPMHPEIHQDKPGMCPECGMALVKTKPPKASHAAHDKHAGHSTNMFKARFWVSLVLSVPVILYSDILEVLFGWMAPAFTGSQLIAPVFGSIIFWYGGWVFVASAWRELRAKAPGMMTLISLAIVTAYSYSMISIFTGGETLFWELATLITIMLLGHWIEMRAVQGAQGALRELSKLLPDVAEVLRDGQTLTISLNELRVGDKIVVRPGGKVAADGVVREGESELNESMMTGESRPVHKQQGDAVIAGTINGNGRLLVEVTQVGEHTFLAGVMRLVAEAQASKSKLQVLSDRAAFALTIIAIVVGGITFTVWTIVRGEPSFAISRVVAVLVIACPHALGLAIPLVASISTTLAARNGFLVRQRLALEAARNVNIVVFDKTGTLTTGTYGVEAVIPIAGKTEDDVLRYAAAVDAHSEHYISRAILEYAKTKGITIPEAQQFSRIPGMGVHGTVLGASVFVGGAAILDAAGVSASDIVNLETYAAQGKSVIYVVVDGKVLGGIALGDIIRSESRDAINSLRSMGISVAMLTGDSEQVAQWVAKDLGISEVFSRVLPDQKADKIKLLQSRGYRVTMVGDGINDAPALTQADVGIAIGAGTNVAIESAGIILVRNDPRDIPRVIELSRRTYSKMVQNLFWATGYNVVAIPLAAGVLSSYGILLEPAVAAILMSLSTVIVAFNAVLLRRTRLS